jgi:hypothetical protein
LNLKQVLIVTVFGCVAVGCGGPVEELSDSTSAVHDDDEDSDSDSDSDSNTRQLRRTFRAATKKYRKVNKAIADGFVRLQEPCFVEEWTEGTGEDIHLGVVYVNPGRMDGTIDPNNPEILYYEPKANGKLKLMGGEHFCPVEACPTAPTLFGFTFRFEEDTGGWALHTWAWLRNPNGLTHPINPRVDTTHCNGCAHPGEEPEECHE